jgi:small nuclear ribonucleoprotein (snRNP)-like protein
LSKIQQEISKATGIDQGRDSRADFLRKLAAGVAKLGDKDWDALTSAAQDWYDAAVDAMNDKKDPPEFSDYVAEETTTRRRRRAEEDEKSSSGPYAPKAGDIVNVTTKRGKTYEGVKVVEIDKDDLVLDDGKDEIVVSLSTSTVVPANSGDGDGEGSSDDDPKSDQPAFDDDGFKNAEIGDTVQVKTKRGKIVMGRVTDVDKAGLALELPDGGKDDFDFDRLDECVIKAKGKQPEPESRRRRSEPEPDKTESRRSRGSAEPEKEQPAAEGRRTRSSNGEVSVSQRINEIIAADLSASMVDVENALTKEKLDFKPATVKLNYVAAHKLIEALKKAGRLK